MAGEVIQVRDVPTEDVQELRARSAARGVSLSQYLRELIHDETSRPAMTDVLERIASRQPVEASVDDIRSFITEGRQ
ncbi:hypothetical protein [Flexivirga alba]|uniref:Antitoxin n=1 Tax=Flexivirga alba TaxID=702742 RepID=A0ABW2AM53_9MICO